MVNGYLTVHEATERISGSRGGLLAHVNRVTVLAPSGPRSQHNVLTSRTCGVQAGRWDVALIRCEKVENQVHQPIYHSVATALESFRVSFARYGVTGAGVDRTQLEATYRRIGYQMSQAGTSPLHPWCLP